jgi:hypothetical protein
MTRGPESAKLSAIREAGLLMLLTAAALFIHGYHPAAEDAEIYLPQIKRILDPALYPFGSEFFQSHAHLTRFPNFVAALVRMSHLSLSAVLLILHIASIFLLLAASKRIASKCFPSQVSQWSGVALVAALLTLPVAGTDLYLLDQYFNPRSISTFAILFAIDAVIDGKYVRAGLWLVFTGLIHPLMVVFGVIYVLLLASTRKIVETKQAPVSAAVAALAFPPLLAKGPSAAFTETLHAHRYYFVLEWRWYEWLGIVAPLGILWWVSRIAERKGRPVLRSLALSLIALGVISLICAVVISIPQRLEVLTIAQPMRSFQLIYLLLALMGGGLLGESILKKQFVRWAALFLPLSLVMAYAQFEVFPSDRHIEWPGARSTNPWVEAFRWVRANTATDAVFVLDPKYMAKSGEDYQGFRAIAERSRLADATKDWSASAMFPGLPLADECLEQVRAAAGLGNFGPADFERLNRQYGVTWIVIEQPGIPGLSCPYENPVVRVCRTG